MNTQPTHIPHRKPIRQRKGSVLITVLLVATVMSLVVGSLVRLGVEESRVNSRHFLFLNARNAAESAVEFGVAQLTERWRTQVSFPSDDLHPDNRPINLSQELVDFFEPLNIDNIAVDGGVIEVGRFYINPSDPANQFDSQKGKMVLVRSVAIYGRATITDPRYGEMTAYARQTLQLRDAPLFSHATFYNMDLEFHPGPVMTMNGPVHANGDIWIQAIDTLTFTDSLTATGNIRYGYMLNAGKSNQVTQSGNVMINNGRGGYTTPYKGSGSKTSIDSYWDSLSPQAAIKAAGYNNWRELASNRWGGNVQDSAHSVPKLNPIGFKDYVRDNPATAAIDDPLNYGYAIIEPNQPAEDPDDPGYVNPIHKGMAETEKFSHKAGLIIRVHYSADGVTQHDGTPLPANAVRLRSRPDQNNPYTTATANPATGKTPNDYNTNYYLSFARISRSNPLDPSSANYNVKSLKVRDNNGNEIVDDDGDPITQDVFEIVEVPINVIMGTNVGGINFTNEFEEMFAAYEYRELANGTPASSFYDPRRRKGVDIIEINMANLRRSIDLYNTDQFDGYNAHQHYNGIIYVEFPTDTSATVRDDKIVRSIDDVGLLISAATRIPDPNSSTSAPHLGNPLNEIRPSGLTLVTNNAMYIKGHFNADGLSNTGTNTQPDGTGTWNPNPPAAVVADAIMPLSNSWRFENSKKALANRVATFTEFNAAMIQGLRPTGKGGTSTISGGNHNFPRFLEKWTGVEFRYRGSMVALFESEVAREGTDETAYEAPNRNWGFYSEFRDGNYPPGTPNMRSFRKIDFEFLTAEQYNAEISALWD